MYCMLVAYKLWLSCAWRKIDDDENNWRVVVQNKGEGGGGDGAESNSDKDRLWMRMYHFSGEQLHGKTASAHRNETETKPSQSSIGTVYRGASCRNLRRGEGRSSFFFPPSHLHLLPEARVCGTVCHRTYDKTWASRVSSINWKHFCLRIRQPRRIVTVAIVRHRNTLTYLLPVGPFKPARRSGERSSPSGVGGGDPAENEFGALQTCQKATSGNHFEYSEYHVLRVRWDKQEMVSP